MSIFANRDTRLVVQGITGRDGSFHARQMCAERQESFDVGVWRHDPAPR